MYTKSELLSFEHKTDRLPANRKLLAAAYEMIAMTIRTDTDIDFVMIFTKIPFP